jgi:hypothetical protein
MYKNWTDFGRMVIVHPLVIVGFLSISSIVSWAQPSVTSADPVKKTGGLMAPAGGALALDKSATALQMTSTEWQFNRDFKFQNTTSSPITITDVNLSQGDVGFQVMSPSQSIFPLTIAPGKSLAIRLGYSKPQGQSGLDSLVITKDGGETLLFPIVVTHVAVTAEQNGYSRRQIALSVTSDPQKRSVQVILYSGYQGDIGIYTKDGKLIDEAKNVRSYIWHATPGKKTYDENEYVVQVKCIDGGQTLTRSETVSFASK